MRSDEFCWKAGIQNSSLTAPFVGGLAGDPYISGLNDATSSGGRNLASKVVGDIIVCIETDPASRTARHPGDRLPEVSVTKSGGRTQRKVAVSFYKIMACLFTNR